MASRTEQKTAARERRLAEEQATRQAAGRRRRRQLLAVVVAIAVVVVVVAIVVSSGGSRSHRSADTHRLQAQVTTLLHGIPQHGETLGDARAPYTLTFFGDLQCPVCAAFATGGDLGVVGGLPAFIATQVRTGHAKVVYHSLCTATCRDFGARGPALFDEQQTAAYAAGEQDRFWDYEELFYRQQGPEGSPYMTPSFLRRLAGEVPGLDVATWTRERTSPALSAQVAHDATLALSLPAIDGGRGTPGIEMSGPGGSRFVNEGNTSISQLETAMRAVA